MRNFVLYFDTADMTNYTPNLLAQYQDSLKDYRDLKNSMDTYLAEGEAKGLKKTAKNAIKEGFSDEIIQKLTGLSLPEIAQIRKECKE